MVNMIDCATRQTNTSAMNLKNQGITHIGRYLSNSYKGMTATETAILKSVGLNIVSVYENGSTSNAHFTVDQAVKDLNDAYTLAKAIGQPEVAENAIYFTVDYDAGQTDLPRILAYFQEIKKHLTSYKLGVYGSYAVVNYLKQYNVCDYYWQTYAWSYGNKANFINLFQYKNDTTLNSVSFGVDYDELVTSDVGAWGQPKPQVTNVLGTVTVETHTVLRDAPSGSANLIHNVEVGEQYKCYGTDHDWFNVGGGYIHCGYASFKPS